MKVLIWFLCIFANALLTTLLKQSGILLGAIPTMIIYGITIWCARALCKKWDEHKAKNVFDYNNPIESENYPNAKIIFCRKCGEKLVENSLFCRKCGTKIPTKSNNAEYE